MFEIPPRRIAVAAFLASTAFGLHLYAAWVRRGISMVVLVVAALVAGTIMVRFFFAYLDGLGGHRPGEPRVLDHDPPLMWMRGFLAALWLAVFVSGDALLWRHAALPAGLAYTAGVIGTAVATAWRLRELRARGEDW